MSVARKKIVFILPALTAGGSERVMASFANSINRQLYEPVFIALKDGPIRDWIDDDIPLHILDQRYFISAFFSLIIALKTIRPNIIVSSIVHVNVITIFAKFFLPHFKLILRESSLPSAMVKGYGWKSRLCHFAYKFLYPKADLLICPSRQILNQFQDDLNVTLKKSVIIYNPVNVKNIRDRIKQKEKSDVLKLVTVGRLTFEKGYYQLIEALAEHSIHRAWKLKIIGEGKERPKLENLIKKHNLQEHISLLGHQDDPWSIISQSDIFLLTSLWEGMPNAALEALASGTPVFALRSAGGIVEVSNMTDESSVRLFDDLESLISSINQFESTSDNASLLPTIFNKDAVYKKFHAVLAELE